MIARINGTVVGAHRTRRAGSFAAENTSDGHDRAGLGSGTASGSVGAVPAASPRASAASRWGDWTREELHERD